MPKDVSNDDDPELPFPGEYGPNGFATYSSACLCLWIRYRKGLTNKELSEHCKTFDLLYTGNKTVPRRHSCSHGTIHNRRLKHMPPDSSRPPPAINYVPGHSFSNTLSGDRKFRSAQPTSPPSGATRFRSLEHYVLIVTALAFLGPNLWLEPDASHDQKRGSNDFGPRLLCLRLDVDYPDKGIFGASLPQVLCQPVTFFRFKVPLLRVVAAMHIPPS
ncbi:hypothetical protein B0H14DRAFT_3568747 [Mycena olivaceomarginata]|nr:hypothetical protein B0H14DRAFT_3568747 [Mycena olivaceomarginata]